MRNSWYFECQKLFKVLEYSSLIQIIRRTVSKEVKNSLLVDRLDPILTSKSVVEKQCEHELTESHDLNFYYLKNLKRRRYNDSVTEKPIAVIALLPTPFSRSDFRMGESSTELTSCSVANKYLVTILARVCKKSTFKFLKRENEVVKLRLKFEKKSSNECIVESSEKLSLNLLNVFCSLG